jgi:hypothetical protein
MADDTRQGLISTENRNGDKMADDTGQGLISTENRKAHSSTLLMRQF